MDSNFFNYYVYLLRWLHGKQQQHIYFQFGKKWTMIYLSVPFIAGWVLLVSAVSKLLNFIYLFQFIFVWSGSVLFFMKSMKLSIMHGQEVLSISWYIFLLPILLAKNQIMIFAVIQIFSSYLIFRYWNALHWKITHRFHLFFLSLLRI